MERDIFRGKVAISSSLGRIQQRVMSFPNFSPSDPFIGFRAHIYPSKHLPKHVFLSPPPSKLGAYFPLNTHRLVGVWGAGGGECIIAIYYYTPLPLNLANKQVTSKQATTSKQASTSPFRFGHCSASSLRALLYSSHPRA